MVSLSGLFILQAFAQEQVSRLSSRLKIINARDPAFTRNLSQSFDENMSRAGKARTFIGLPSLNKHDFDFINLYQGSREDSKTTAIIAAYKGKNRFEKIAFVLFRSKEKYGRPMLIKATPDRSSLAYYDLESGTVLKIQREGNSFSYTTSLIDNDGTAARRTSCGQAVTDCVTEAYANHGWTSVWLTFQSFFLPATGAAIVGACIWENCL